MAGVSRGPYPGVYTGGQTPGSPTNLKAPTGGGTGVEGTYTPDDVRQTNSPSGYEWNPINADYQRTPTSTGTRGGQEVSAFMNAAGFGGLAGGLTGALGGLQGAGGGAAAFGGGSSQMQPNFASGPISAVGHIGMPDQTGAENATFASAKDRVGQNSKAALSALNDAMAGQGMLGSGAQVQGSRDIIQSGMGELGDVRRQQAVTHAGNALDVAKMGYQGDIAQRGQNIQAQEANARLAQEANQLAFQRQQAGTNQQLQLMSLALSGLKGLY